MKETGLTGKRRSTTIAATPDDGKSQRKRRSECVSHERTVDGGLPERWFCISRKVAPQIIRMCSCGTIQRRENGCEKANISTFDLSQLWHAKEYSAYGKHTLK